MVRSIVITELGLQAFQKTPLTKVEGVILWHLIGRFSPSGDVISIAQLESSLSISHRTANTTMKRLSERGFLVRGPKIGVSHHYKLNPVFFKVLS
jgi:Fic family protein